ncbi:amidase family protein [Herbaspirillum rubrisubalbicans]|uniref:amidase family protein n=1 Tax=Herbaspirillum rubrisubalbicans TaxID=80842 RepID=UPI0020A2312A|nr:amidase family protein [Herbaspirillum rubrisubalbicans]MCP1576608.1 Asp-tRNA(Asn)/Glu-tRNA(Gln) amidotransferase A subunit family amidase [Herbaspirillum rubrisubalbicans]
MNCQLSATTGMPAHALPVFFTEDGLPVSLELLAPEFSESALLDLAYGWEKKISLTLHTRTSPLGSGRKTLVLTD